MSDKIRLTKEIAIQESIILWHKLVGMPNGSTKIEAIQQYPSLGHLSDYYARCPGCQYDIDILGSGCSSCPIWGGSDHTCNELFEYWLIGYEADKALMVLEDILACTNQTLEVALTITKDTPYLPWRKPDEQQN